MGKLASHIANIPNWILTRRSTVSVFDLASIGPDDARPNTPRIGRATSWRAFDHVRDDEVRA